VKIQINFSKSGFGREKSVEDMVTLENHSIQACCPFIFGSSKI
jgi:hypothetical protein